MICPFMSRPYLHKYNCNGYIEEDTRLHEVECLKSGCMAWRIKDRECTATFECKKYEESGYDDSTCDNCKHAKGEGYCKLINPIKSGGVTE